MAEIPLVMPKMSMTMTEGIVVVWHKQEGDEVRSGDVVAEVTTDKVDMEVESPVDGVLARLVAEPEDVVPVGEPIAFLTSDSDDLLGDLLGDDPEPDGAEAPTPGAADSDAAPADGDDASADAEPAADAAPADTAPTDTAGADGAPADTASSADAGGGSAADAAGDSADDAAYADVADPASADSGSASASAEATDASSGDAGSGADGASADASAGASSGNGTADARENVAPVDSPQAETPPTTQADPPEAPTPPPARSPTPPPARSSSPPPARSSTPPESEPSSPSPSGNGWVASVPLARSRARELQVDLARVHGTGPGGAVRVTDVEAAASTPASSGAQESGADRGAERRRAALAKRMTESAAVPQFVVFRDLDLEDLAAARDGVSWTAVLLTAFAAVLRDDPVLHARWAGERRRPHDEVVVSVAVDTPDGLLAPSLAAPDRMPLREVDDALRALATRAREGRLSVADLTPGTTTVSNLGGMAVDAFTVLLSPPQATALSLGTVGPVPVAVPGGLGVRVRCRAGLAVDHRVAAGADAARLLQRLQDRCADPSSLGL